MRRRTRPTVGTRWTAPAPRSSTRARCRRRPVASRRDRHHGGMSTETQEPVDAVTWDLAPLVDDGGDEAVDRLLDDAERRANEFRARYAGKVAELDAGGLREAMTELSTIYELVGRAGSY